MPSPAKRLPVVAPLPCGECRGRCCFFAPMTMREFKDIRRKHGVPRGAVVEAMRFRAGSLPGVPPGSPGVTVSRGDGSCAYLVDGKCSVYDLRPRACRAYGTVEAMPCQYLHPEAAERATAALVGLIEGAV